MARPDKGPDWPEFLLEMVRPFSGRVGIEFFIHTYLEAYMEQLWQIKKWTGDLPLAFHGPFVTVEASSRPGTPEYDWFVQSYMNAFKLARKFGGKQIVFHDHERFVNPEEKHELQIQCLENIRMLEKKASAFGIRLLLENLALPDRGTPVFDEGEYMDLFRQFPEADCLIDVGHLAVAGWDMERVIRTLGGRIRAYHLHNNDGKADSHLRIGDGVISYSHFFELYKKYTPEADLTLEYGSDHGITAGQVIEDLNYVLEQIG